MDHNMYGVLLGLVVTILATVAIIAAIHAWDALYY